MPRKTSGCAPTWPRGERFNEAAARCHGKRSIRSTSISCGCSCFNEAAARCHGKRYRAAQDRTFGGGLQ